MDAPSSAPNTQPQRKTLTPSAEFVKEMADEQATAPNSKPLAPGTPSAPPRPSAPTAAAGPLQAAATEQPPTNKAAQVASVYPDLPEVPTVSAAPKEYIEAHSKTGTFDGVPKGVIVITALTVISTIAQFIFGSSSDVKVNSNVLLFVAIISIALAVGLLFASNICRIIFMCLFGLALFNNGLRVLQLSSVKQSINNEKTTLTSQINFLKSENKGAEKGYADSQINALQSRIDADNAVTDAAISQAYLIYSANIAFEIFAVSYLLRPSVKRYFGVL